MSIEFKTKSKLWQGRHEEKNTPKDFIWLNHFEKAQQQKILPRRNPIIQIVEKGNFTTTLNCQPT